MKTPNLQPVNPWQTLAQIGSTVDAALAPGLARWHELARADQARSRARLTASLPLTDILDQIDREVLLDDGAEGGA